LLEGIVADPDQRISDLPLLPVAERDQLLLEWNDTRVEYRRDDGIHQLFESQAERSPEAVAVVFEDDQLTYGELEHRANQLAHHLQALGVGPDTLVGIYMERSVEMMVGLLGVLKAGGAYVPLDPAFPQERLAFMLADSQAPVLLTQQRLLAVLPESEARVLCLDTDWPAIGRESEDRPVSAVKPTDLAYVIYTSGSTGKPKGVQISHRAGVNFLNSMGRQPGLTQQDVLLAVTTLSFDIALLELFLPIIVGARVVIVSSEVAADGYQLQERMARCGATVMQATPATWRLLLETDWPGSQQLKVLCGGEGLPRELANQLLERVGSLWNMYGPTETTVWSTVHAVESGVGPILIGRPIDNTEIYILDSRLQPVPIGVPGELYIGGDGLARGYFNRPNLTTEKFIAHPFSEEPQARIYNTGDMASYLPDGTIECLGRMDHQVKIRGFRIELGEIEAVLGQHPGIEESVVIVREDVPGDKQLVGYLIANQEPVPTVGELRSFLKQKLPDYMVPSTFVEIEALPLTPNRKVDRRALPAPDVVHDNFFELGGHSLLATRVVAQIQQEFEVDLKLMDFFKLPTIAELGKGIEGLLWIDAGIPSDDEVEFQGGEEWVI
jgi:amino acid adenylation domain-containing protein